MTVLRYIAYIAAGILIFFGIIFIYSAFSPQGQVGNILVGLISVGIGFGLIWLGTHQRASQSVENVTLKIDLPANIDLDTLKCRACGGALTTENIKMVAGAPVVTCPYCGTTYQLTEEPKW